jgi:hypothetical protein
MRSKNALNFRWQMAPDGSDPTPHKGGGRAATLQPSSPTLLHSPSKDGRSSERPIGSPSKDGRSSERPIGEKSARFSKAAKTLSLPYDPP